MNGRWFWFAAGLGLGLLVSLVLVPARWRFVTLSAGGIPVVLKIDRLTGAAYCAGAMPSATWRKIEAAEPLQAFDPDAYLRSKSDADLERIAGQGTGATNRPRRDIFDGLPDGAKTIDPPSHL